MKGGYYMHCWTENYNFKYPKETISNLILDWVKTFSPTVPVTVAYVFNLLVMSIIGKLLKFVTDTSTMVIQETKKCIYLAEYSVRSCFSSWVSELTTSAAFSSPLPSQSSSSLGELNLSAHIPLFYFIFSHCSLFPKSDWSWFFREEYVFHQAVSVFHCTMINWCDAHLSIFTTIVVWVSVH